MNSPHHSRARIFAFLLLLLLSLQVLLYAFYFNSEQSHARANQSEKMLNRLEVAEEVLIQALVSVVHDARFLASDPTPRDLDRLIAAHGHYDSILLLAPDGGVDLLRERGVVGKPSPAKTDEYRALIGKLQSADSLWLGEFTLASERGEVKVPFRPIWSMAVRRAAEGGMLMLRLDTRPVFARLQSQIPGLWLINHDGYWLDGGESADRYQWLFGGSGGKTLAQRHPELAAAMKGKQAGVYADGERQIAYRRIDLTRALAANLGVELGGASDVWMLAEVPAPMPLQWFWWPILLGTLFSGLLAGGLSLWLARVPRVVASGREAMLQKLLDAAPVGLIISEADGLRCYVNAHWCALAGVAPDAALELGWKSAVHPEDLPLVEESWRVMQVERRQVDLEYRFLHQDGTECWVHGSLLPIALSDQESVYLCVVRDVSDSRLQARRLQQSLDELELAHDELYSILNSSLDAIVALDPGFCLTMFNTAYAELLQRLYGVTVERGTCLLNILEPVSQDRAGQMTLFGRALQGDRFQARQDYGDVHHARRTFDLSLSPQYNHAGKLIGALMLMRDVTESSRIGDALKRREELFRAAIESSLDAILVLEAVKNKAWEVEDFRIVEANQNAFDLFGYSREEAIGGLLCELLPATRTTGLFDKYRRVFESGMPLLEERAINNPAIKADWLHYQGVAISNGIALTLRDISDRKEVEQRLLENEARMAAIVANVQDGVITVDWLGTIRSANPICHQLFGRSYTDLVGQSLSILFPQILPSLGEGDLFTACRERLGVEAGIAREVQALHRAGHLVPVEMTLKQVMLARETFYAVTLHDLAERKESERLMQNHIRELQALQSSLNETNDQLTQANQELSRLAHLDGLTGLANRRYFDEHYTQEWSRSCRENVVLCVAMVDVDYFKRYNDGYGHQAGDECLKKIAAVLAHHMRRPGDFAARYGGEEFVLVMPNTTAQGAAQVLDDILQSIRDLQMPHAFSDVADCVTISAGVAAIRPVMSLGPEVLVLEADQSLYRAKQTGRNRCVLTEMPDPAVT